MTTITISISEDRFSQLASFAKKLGIAPEELVRASLEDW